MLRHRLTSGGGAMSKCSLVYARCPPADLCQLLITRICCERRDWVEGGGGGSRDQLNSVYKWCTHEIALKDFVAHAAHEKDLH